MKTLYGTTNPAKLTAMKNTLEGLDIELISLKDITEEIPSVSENGNTPLENAVEKARAYYNAFKIPVFSCDSGLYFENLPEFSPMVHVRNVGGKCLTDEEMTEYYGALAAKYGDIVARYKNAVCFVYDENNVFTDESDDLCGNRFIITSKPHPKREAGFPLDRLSKRIDTGRYYYDDPEPLVGAMASGFKRFFSETLSAVSDRKITEDILIK